MCAGTPPSRSKDALARKNTDHEAADELHLKKKKIMMEQLMSAN
jgi:hypothetical protein